MPVAFSKPVTDIELAFAGGQLDQANQWWEFAQRAEGRAVKVPAAEAVRRARLACEAAVSRIDLGIDRDPQMCTAPLLVKQDTPDGVPMLALTWRKLEDKALLWRRTAIRLQGQQPIAPAFVVHVRDKPQVTPVPLRAPHIVAAINVERQLRLLALQLRAIALEDSARDATKRSRALLKTPSNLDPAPLDALLNAGPGAGPMHELAARHIGSAVARAAAIGEGGVARLGATSRIDAQAEALSAEADTLAVPLARLAVSQFAKGGITVEAADLSWEPVAADQPAAGHVESSRAALAS